MLSLCCLVKFVALHAGQVNEQKNAECKHVQGVLFFAQHVSRWLGGWNINLWPHSLIMIQDSLIVWQKN